MSDLPFLRKEYPYEKVRKFEDLLEHDLPDRAGVYVLMAQRGYTFRYPNGKSSVFYVGQSQSLRRRLKLHLKFSLQVRKKRDLLFHWPRYEWAAVLQTRYTYLLTQPREPAKRLEENVIAMFATRYRSWPIANGAGSWNSMHHLKELLDNEGRES